MKVFVMSIKPEYSRQIFAGEKRHELRRTPIKAQTSDVVVVYETAPTKAIVGAFAIDYVYRDEVGRLWSYLGHALGISEEAYRAYFEGVSIAHAINVGKLVKVRPITLEQLQARFPGFKAPQSYSIWREPLHLLLGRRAARTVTFDDMTGAL